MMDFRHFPLEAFLKKQEDAEKRLIAFYEGKGPRVAVSQRPGYQFTRALCRYRDRQLESELDFLANCLNYDTDLLCTALEPWVGVGVYAAGFGAKYEWSDTDAPQTRPIIGSPDEIQNLRLKPLSDWEEMSEVIERIRYFKRETHGQMGITLTDTQSPNDTASLLMDSTEFFADCLAEPEAVEPLLDAVTDAIIQYSRIQMEEIGDLWAGPGHIAVSGRGVKGVTLSDDNLAILSPAAYRNASAEYMQRVSSAFGGLYVHSCGLYTHNVPELLKCEGLKMLDCAIDKSADPCPNDPKKMAEALKGRDDVILQVRLSIHRGEVLRPLLDAGIRMHVLFGPDADANLSNRLFAEFKEKYLA